MTIISGIFTNPFGEPLANVTLRLLARGTTSQSFSGTNAAAVTAADGSYSMSVLVGTYAVSAIINRSEDYLGVIQVYSDSVDGTLNEYLTSFNADEATPEVLQEMQALLKEAQDAATTAESYALIPRGEYDADTAYAANDLVEYAGSEYRATGDTTGVAPPATPWELFVSAGADGQVPEGVLNYRGFWSSDETYEIGDVVRTSGGAYEGLYACTWPTTENPTDSIDWERIAGYASSIDGATSAGGNLLYNRTETITDSTYTLQATGELSWTLNITDSCAIDIATLVSDSNANPNAIVRLVISSVSALTVSLTGADAWWLQDSGYTTTAPSFDIDATQPLTIIEVSRVLNAAAPGALVRQVYPVVTDSVQTINGIAPTAGNVAISAQTGNFSGATEVETYTPQGGVLIETAYINLGAHGIMVDLATIASKNSAGTLQPGYTLRFFVYANPTQKITFTNAGTLRFNGEIQSGNLAIQLAAGVGYVMELVVGSTSSLALSQLQPTTIPTSAVIVSK